MAVTTNLNSNTKSNGKITEITLNDKLKSNTFLRGYYDRWDQLSRLFLCVEDDKRNKVNVGVCP